MKSLGYVAGLFDGIVDQIGQVVEIRGVGRLLPFQQSCYGFGGKRGASKMLAQPIMEFLGTNLADSRHRGCRNACRPGRKLQHDQRRSIASQRALYTYHFP